MTPSPCSPTKAVGSTMEMLAVILFAFLVRLLVSLGPYSGQGKPPMYGDYEAQRHWMEITLHTPPSEWYRNTSVNDLQYWGLDYPPLTAYQSYAHGLIFLNASVPEAVALGSSRGFESPKSKMVMRWTVLSSDLLIFFPAVIYFVNVYCRRFGVAGGGARRDVMTWFLAMVLVNPCLILTDHGHFQYNCISLGLTIAAVAAVLSNSDIIGSILFCLALNHKQMSAYFAPAFFGHLLGKCLKKKYPVLEVLKLGFTVVLTFGVLWLPYISSLEAIIQVLTRLAPFERGIYEDYVANFWCSSSIIVKWKQLFDVRSLKAISFATTVSSLLPSMLQQIIAPSDHGFLYSLLNSSFSFYLFSYQVHEKSILLPMLPASLLALKDPFVYCWMVHFGLLSMYPLLKRDGLTLQYLALLALFLCLYQSRSATWNLTKDRYASIKKVMLTVTLLISPVLHVVYLICDPPKRYPFLFEALITVLSFSQFVLLTAYANIKQLKSNLTVDTAKKET